MASLEILHAAEHLAELMGEGRLPLREVRRIVAYHDPCDLGRKCKVYEAPRRVLRGIPGLACVEMSDNRETALCCGGGGNLESYDPGLVAALSARRVAQAQQAGAQVIVSACQQCERTLSNAGRQQRARIRVLDIAEMVWEAVAT
jgi:Fe-S oxidoreductase